MLRCQQGEDASRQHMPLHDGKRGGARNDYRPLEKGMSTREYLNQQLRLYCNAHAAVCSLVDLDSEESIVNRRNSQTYSDDIHMNAKGYQAMGQMIANKLIAHIEST
jgi:hypothetical protein